MSCRWQCKILPIKIKKKKKGKACRASTNLMIFPLQFFCLAPASEKYSLANVYEHRNKNSHLSAEKYPCSFRVGSFTSTLKTTSKNSYCKGKKDLYTTNDHYHFKNFSTDSFVAVFIVPSLWFIFNLLLSSRFLCCWDY